MILRASSTALICLTTSAAAAQLPASRTITPWAVASDASTHTFYVVDTARNSIVAIDAKTAKSENITVGQRPIALGLDSSAHRLYTVNAGSGDVSVIDTTDRRVIAQPKTDLHPYAIAVDASLHRVYVSNTFSNQLTVIDGATNTSQQQPLGSKDALLCDPVRHRLYLMSYEDDSLAVQDELTGTTTRLPAMNHMWSMALEPRTGIVHAVSVGGDSLLSLSPGTPTKILRTGSFPAAVALDGDIAVTANYGEGTVTIAQPNGTIAVKVTAHPQAVAIDSRRHVAFVVDTHGGTVSMVDLQKTRLIATVSAGNRPYAIAIDPATHKAVVANYGEDSGPAYTLLSPLP